MFALNHLDALMLEVIIHYVLVVSAYADLPLFKFSDDSLFILFSSPRNITFCSRVLETQAVSILYPQILQSILDLQKRAVLGNYGWDEFQTNPRLSEVGAIQTVNAVNPKNTILILHNLFIFFHAEPKFKHIFLSHID